MKSLNQIISELETFANVHYQIHTFGHGDVWEVAPNSSEIVYPVLWFVPQGATTGLREVTNNFTVLCMDLVRSGEENETEVLSDTLQIILDVVSYYRQQHDQNYIVEFGSNIQPFTERDPDMLAGHSITVSIRQPFNYSECAIPFSGAPTPITPTCSPATIQNAASNPTYQASIASGDSLVLPQVKVLDSDGVTPILANYIPESDGYVAICSTSCDPVTEQVNGVTIGTTPSGDTNNQVIENTLGTPVGTAANPSVVPDATVQLNGTTVGTIASGATDSFAVNLDGSPSGVWDGTAWQVTSTPCADATVELNGVEMATIPSGATENISIRQSSGATEVGSKQGTHWRIDDSPIQSSGGLFTDSVLAEQTYTIADVSWTDSDGSPQTSEYSSAIVCTPSASGALSVTVSNATPTFNSTITVTATATSFTPTSYRFYAQGANDTIFIGTSATNSISWKVVAPHGSMSIYAEAVDGAGVTAYTDTPQAITVTGALFDRFTTATMGFCLEQREYRFFSALLTVRRSSDNATSNFGFVNGSLDTASILTFCGAGDGFVVTWYGQSSNRNIAYQQTAASQPKIVNAGAIVTASNGKPAIDFDGSNDFMNILTVQSLVTGFFSFQNDAIGTSLVQEIIAGTTTAQVIAAGTAVSGASVNDGVSPALQSTLKDLNRHYMSILTGSNDGIYIDNTDITLGALGTIQNLTLIGNRFNQTFYMNGKIQDVIGYPDDQFANRTEIETYLT